METPTTYQTQPNPDPYALTYRERMVIKRLRQLAATGKELAVIEITKDGPCVREVGKREG